MRITLLILIPLIILGIALAGDHILVERLFILAALVLLSGFLIAFSGLRGLKGNLIVPLRRPRVGEPFLVEAATENRAYWPKVFVRLLLKTGLPSGEKDIVINMSPRRASVWRHEMSFHRRGYQTIGPLTAEATDPLGLFRLRRQLAPGKPVLIYPAVIDLPLFDAVKEAGPGFYSSRRADQETDGVISCIRDYVPGDSLSRIHWRSSAHMAKLIVKEFDADLSEKIWVIPDLSGPAGHGSDLEAIEEYIITIAASIARKYSDSGRYVGLLAQNRDYHFHPPHQGSAHLDRIMETLAVANIDGQAPLYRLLDKVSSQFTGNSTITIITAAADQRLADSLLKIKKRGTGVAAVIIDTSSFGSQAFPEQTAVRLATLGIPVYRVKRGDNLATALNSSGNGLKLMNSAGPIAR